MYDFIRTVLIYSLLFGLLTWNVGFTILMWRPLWKATVQGKYIFELYSVKDLLWNAWRALIWPMWAFAPKAG